ncbi:MAG: DUF4386 family protein [Actinomycetota bacterium]|nr:DUF4386 family protein [Actinomycetota bacterium]
MSDKKWEKYAALGGVLFVVLNVAGSIAMGSPPKTDDSNTKILEWFVDKESGIKLALFLGGLSVIALLWWFGSLWRRMTAAEGGRHRLSVIALTGLVGSGVAWMTSAAIQGAVASRTVDLGEAVGFFYALSGGMMSVAGFFLVAHLIAVNGLSMRSTLFPAWTAYLGLLAAAGFLVSTLATLKESGPFMLIGLISFLVWAVWILAVSAHMWRTADSA